MTSSKFVGETITLSFDFQNQMVFGETLDPPLVASVTVTVASGIDANPSEILTGGVTVDGYSVVTKVTAGIPGVVYRLRFHAAGSSGAVYRGDTLLAVMSNVGDASTYPPLELSGDLPDGVFAVVYSESLDIIGGVPPYVDVEITSGTAPDWAIFAIAGDLVTVNGIPDAEGSFTFDVTVTDFAGFRATSAQTINVTSGSILPSPLPTFTPAILVGSRSSTNIYQSTNFDDFLEVLDAGGTVGDDGIVTTSGLAMYRLSTAAGRVSIDGGTSFIDCTGITITNPKGMLRTETETIIYGNSNVINFTLNSNLVNFMSRAIPAAGCVTLARNGTTLLGAEDYSSTDLIRSIDDGRTWGTATALATPITKIFATSHSNFLINGDGIYRSPTGESGTFVNVTPPPPAAVIGRVGENLTQFGEDFPMVQVYVTNTGPTEVTQQTFDDGNIWDTFNPPPNALTNATGERANDHLMITNAGYEMFEAFFTVQNFVDPPFQLFKTFTGGIWTTPLSSDDDDLSSVSFFTGTN